MDMIEKRGGRNINLHKEGHKKFITFVSMKGKQIKVTVRTKTYGDWQTSTTYGKASQENALENEYWVFVDLGMDPFRFYPVPLWWITNNIYEVYETYLKRYGGHRKYNDESTHHKVTLERIRRWEGQWDKMGL